MTSYDFFTSQVLGKGTFGKVILCREKQTHALYAIKVGLALWILDFCFELVAASISDTNAHCRS